MVGDEGRRLAVQVSGSGPRVVFVHGAMTTGARAWSKQQTLAARWSLVVPDRRGYGDSPATGRSDFEVDAADIAELLDRGAHLIGHSYGALAALFAAARRPEAVLSLTVIEPPAHVLARGDPAVEAEIAGYEQRRATLTDPLSFQRAFLAALGVGDDLLPISLDAETERNVRVLMGERPPWDAAFPLEQLRAGGFVTLVVSGGHSATFEMLCDHVAELLAPRSVRLSLPGRGHTVQLLGEPFNKQLEAFLEQASRDNPDPNCRDER